MISVAELLALGGLVQAKAEGQRAIAHGRVTIEQWTIGITESHLPRWVLRGTVITCGGKSMRISDDGCKIQPERRKRVRSLARV